jgi:hypothetical protein
MEIGTERRKSFIAEATLCDFVEDEKDEEFL